MWRFKNINSVIVTHVVYGFVFFKWPHKESSFNSLQFQQLMLQLILTTE